MKESGDVGRAEENVDAIKQQLETIESQMNQEMAGIDTQMNAAAEQLETVPLKPKKSDIEVRTVALAWAPYWKQGDEETSAYE
jgi:archaellum component FlaC